MDNIIPAIYYHGIFYTYILVLCLLESIRIYQYSTNALLVDKYQKRESAVLLSIFLILFIGTRPIDVVFVDTITYAAEYMHPYNLEVDEKRSEWIWVSFANCCKSLGLSVHVWFLLIAFCYIMPLLLACKHWFFRQNIYLAMLFVFSAFSFFSYGVNGLRNGVACSFIIWAMSIYSGKIMNKVVTILLCSIGFFIHKSVALPIICFFISYHVIKKFQWALAIWFFSIILSLTLGTSISSYLGPLLGFDQRLADLLSASSDSEVMQSFSHTGFRWDFLLYSCMPILLGYYICHKKRINDRNYIVLLNTYILANAFWVIVINAAYSNRFAYLSWFLYPIVLAYPLLRLPIWKDQGRKTVYILLFHCTFTYFMWLIK